MTSTVKGAASAVKTPNRNHRVKLAFIWRTHNVPLRNF